MVGSGRVLLTRDVEVVGERLASGVTTIQGGSLPFLGLAATRTVIRGIRFEGPLRGAAWFLGPPEADTELVGNTVADVVGRFFPCCGTVAEALAVQGGRVRIAGNVVDHVDSESGIGISQFFSAGPVEIVGNRVSGTSTIGIESTGNDGAVRILDNVIRPGPAREDGACCGRGIEINGTGAYLVARNDIVVENPNFGDGILAFGDVDDGFSRLTAAVIENNDITLQSGLVGLSLGGRAFDSYVGQNRIAGSALAAFNLFDTSSFDPGSDVGFNTLVGNNIAGLDSSEGDVFLDLRTHDTVLKGKSGSVVDLGTNNHITGFSSGGPGNGQQLSEATRRRNEAVKAAHANPHASSSGDY